MTDRLRDLIVAPTTDAKKSSKTLPRDNWRFPDDPKTPGETIDAWSPRREFKMKDHRIDSILSPEMATRKLHVPGALFDFGEAEEWESVSQRDAIIQRIRVDLRERVPLGDELQRDFEKLVHGITRNDATESNWRGDQMRRTDGFQRDAGGWTNNKVADRWKKDDRERDAWDSVDNCPTTPWGKTVQSYTKYVDRLNPYAEAQQETEAAIVSNVHGSTNNKKATGWGSRGKDSWDFNSANECANCAATWSSKCIHCAEMTNMSSDSNLGGAIGYASKAGGWYKQHPSKLGW